MKSDQARVFLRARIKLMKRQLLEWNTLLIYQRTLRESVNEKMAKRPARYFNAVQTTAELVIRQATRLKKIMGSQQEDLRQMKTRHRREEADLEAVLKTAEQNSL